MHLMDIAAAISAQKHSNHIVVTVSVDNVSFKQPIKLGDVITIEVKVTRAFTTSMEVRLDVRVIGKKLRLSIADNGQGLPPDTIARGGDGLANMRTRLEKMGGRFEITSQNGRGTVVRFYFPLNL